MPDQTEVGVTITADTAWLVGPGNSGPPHISPGVDDHPMRLPGDHGSTATVCLVGNTLYWIDE